MSPLARNTLNRDRPDRRRNYSRVSPGNADSVVLRRNFRGVGFFSVEIDESVSCSSNGEFKIFISLPIKTRQRVGRMAARRKIYEGDVEITGTKNTRSPRKFRMSTIGDSPFTRSSGRIDTRGIRRAVCEREPKIVRASAARALLIDTHERPPLYIVNRQRQREQSARETTSETERGEEESRVKGSRGESRTS